MSSIIEGYNYDIFISYRQKDNKHDGWVTEFVDNLKGELESTFKEEISVYFDINPHDGLLETHDVNASLKEKLKCLVFIPIISRTYCDPKSFAWEHEFQAFVEQASHDQFGLKVKLLNGNVASRVLPVRIHDLDNNDIKLCESIIGGVLRGIEFVYKEPGVDKPLSPEDDEKKNSNNTKYRIQIIKVAHAIKEIILGMKGNPVQTVNDKIQANVKFNGTHLEENKSEIQKTVISSKKWPFLIFGIATILIIVGTFLYPKIFKHDKFEELRDADGRISIAVMPFENLTGDAALNWFQRGISSLIINRLGGSSELAVRDDQTMFEIMESMGQVFTAGISPSQAKKVAEKGKAEAYISGSFQGIGGKYRILTNLVDTKSGEIICTRMVEGDLKSAGYLDMTDLLCNELRDFLEIKALGEKADRDFRDIYPESAEAYRFFIEGINSILTYDNESAIQSLKKALKIDSTFTFAHFYIAWVYAYGYGANSDQYDQYKIWAEKAYERKEKLPTKYQLWVELWHTIFTANNPSEITRQCELVEESGLQSRWLWFDLGVTYHNYVGQYEKAVEAYEKVIEISLERDGYWKYESFYGFYGKALHVTGNHNKENEFYEIGLSLFPKSISILFHQIVCAYSLNDTSKANIDLAKFWSIAKEKGFSESAKERLLGRVFQSANVIDLAEKHYRNAFKLEPQNIDNILNLAQLLINHDRNVNEGMGLIDKGLEIKSDSYNLLKIKGWGYFKQGKIEEAIIWLKKAEEKSFEFDFELYTYSQEVKKSIANQKTN